MITATSPAPSSRASSMRSTRSRAEIVREAAVAAATPVTQGSPQIFSPTPRQATDDAEMTNVERNQATSCMRCRHANASPDIECALCHRSVCTNCIAPLDIDQCAECKFRQIYKYPDLYSMSQSFLESEEAAGRSFRHSMGLYRNEPPPQMREQQRQLAQQEEQPPIGITGAQLQERLAQICGNDFNPWQHRSIQFQAAGTIQQSPQTATPGYAPQGDWMPPYAWYPQHPNHMPPRRNYDQPMDAAVAPEYYAHMRGVPLQSAPPVSSHVQAMTNALHATAPIRSGG